MRAATVSSLFVITLLAGACGDGGRTNGGSQTVDVAGGEVSVAGINLSFPPGAVAQEVDITVSEGSPQSAAAYTAYSPVFHFEPSGTRFAKPVQVKIPFTGADPKATLFWSTADGSGFEGLPSTIVGGVVQAEVSHFSKGFVASSLGGYWTLGVSTIGCGSTGGPVTEVSIRERLLFTADGRIHVLVEEQNWAAATSCCTAPAKNTFCLRETWTYEISGNDLTVTASGMRATGSWQPDRITLTADGRPVVFTRAEATPYAPSCQRCPHEQP